MEPTHHNIYSWSEFFGRMSIRDECHRIILNWLSTPELAISEYDLRDFDFSNQDIYVLYLAAMGASLYKEIGMPIDPAEVKKDTLGSMVIQCNHCGENTTKSLCIWTADKVPLCTKCRKNAVVNCTNCGRKFPADDTRINVYQVRDYVQFYCHKCRPSLSENSRIRERGYNTSAVIGKGTGDFVQSDRAWSVEIECYLTKPQEFATRLSKLPKNFGIIHDGSLVNDGSRSENNNTQTVLSDGRVLKQGIEIQTPILRGVEGEQYLSGLCKALNAKENAYVDTTCGLHIHLDMGDYLKAPSSIQRLMVFHWIYEDVIRSFLPANRRKNIYTQSLKNDYALKQITQEHSFHSLRNLWYRKNGRLSRYNKKHPRYHGINFHSLYHEGHAEVRYHSGTTNAAKIMHWVNLHTRIVDYCNGNYGEPPTIESLVSTGLTPKGYSPALSKLTRDMFERLNLSKECVSYFRERQKKFIGKVPTTEAEFIEKEEKSGDDSTMFTMQLSTLEEYQKLLSEVTQTK